MKLGYILYSSTILLAGVTAGAGLAMAKMSAPATSSTSVVGAFPAPPTGSGPGILSMLHMPTGVTHTATFARAGTPAGNSFYVAVDSLNKRIYIPSVAGITYIMNLNTGKIVQHFGSIYGGRVARISPNHKTLFVVSNRWLAAYNLANNKQRYRIRVGGNAMVFNPSGTHLFVGGNMDKSIDEIATSNGHVLKHINIGHTGDMVWADGKLFSADMSSGIMSVYNAKSGKIIQLKTGEVDPNFNYKRIPTATAGFMQLAFSPKQHMIYAAGYSGHILRFSSKKPAYLGEVKVTIGRPGPNRLSGLATLPNSNDAIATIENRNESVIVNLKNGKVIKLLPQIISNRWVRAG